MSEQSSAASECGLVHPCGQFVVLTSEEQGSTALKRLNLDGTAQLIWLAETSGRRLVLGDNGPCITSISSNRKKYGEFP